MAILFVKKMMKNNLENENEIVIALSNAASVALISTTNQVGFIFHVLIFDAPILIIFIILELKIHVQSHFNSNELSEFLKCSQCYGYFYDRKGNIESVW